MSGYRVDPFSIVRVLGTALGMLKIRDEEGGK
jgi:hypothetical protein